jgi:hypothetical protein
MDAFFFPGGGRGILPEIADESSHFITRSADRKRDVGDT